MLKQNALRRILVATIALVITGFLCLFPSNENNLLEVTNYIDTTKLPIYLLNSDNYVIKTTYEIDNNELSNLEKVDVLIEALKNKNNTNIPEFARGIIPHDAKLIDKSLENGLLKLNFSEELLNIDKEMEEKLIEALVYTLTEINDIKEIMIFINNEKLEVLPKSGINLPNTLDRTLGINKIYDLTSIKDSSKRTIYYIGKYSDMTYYIPITKIDNNNQNKIEIIIEELKSSPTYDINLMSYLASNTILEDYEILENSINLSFNNAIFEDFNNKNILEEVKYSISYSLKDSLDIEEVNFIVDDEVIATFKES